LSRLLLRSRTRSELAHLIRLLALLSSQLIELLLSLSNPLLEILGISLAIAILIQRLTRLLNGVGRSLLGLLLLLRSATLFSLTQIIRRVAKGVRSLPRIRIIILAGLLFELALQFFEIAAKLLDVPLVPFSVLRLTLLSLNFSLLPARQFRELVLDFLFLLGLLLAFTALDGFILVSVLVQFEFEEIGEILRALLTTATTTATAALSALNLDVGIEGSGSAEELEGFQFRRQRAVGIVLHQSFGGRPHLLDRFVHVLRQLFDHGVLIGKLASFEASHQSLRRLGDLVLAFRDGVKVIVQLLGIHGPLGADHLLGRYIDVLLPASKSFGIVILATLSTATAATTATTAATAILSLTELTVEWADINEIRIGLDDIRRIARIGRHGVIRDEVAGLQLELLQEERVRPGDLF